jgi:LysR family transcriptional regulator, transcriptional activator of nhaA
LAWLNYHHLYYFYVIAREGSIAKASRKLKVGQPALSTQLKQLESILGHELFTRKQQRLNISPFGRHVFDYASEIFRLGRELQESAKQGAAVSRRVTLQIGALDSVPKDVVHQLVVSAYEIGDCYVSITEAGVTDLLRDLQQHRLHLVIANTPAPIAPRSQFYSRSVGEMPVIVCGAPKFARLKKDFPKSLGGKPFIIPSRHSKLRFDIEQYFESRSLRPEIIGDSMEAELDKRLALSGHALIAIAEQSVQRILQDGALVKLGALKGITEHLWLTATRRHVPNPIAAKLIQDFSIR